MHIYSLLRTQMQCSSLLPNYWALLVHWVWTLEGVVGVYWEGENMFFFLQQSIPHNHTYLGPAGSGRLGTPGVGERGGWFEGPGGGGRGPGRVGLAGPPAES